MHGPSIPFAPNARYPDPAVEILHDTFARYRVYSSSVEQLASGCRWSEGPQWFADHRCLLWSDIPGNRILRWDEASGMVTTFRSPSNHANGLARDLQGRLLACEHLTRRVTRTEVDGSITVLADRFDGKRLNSPNDIVCQRNGAVWFTDPPFGIHGWWEGEPATAELSQGVYRIDPANGRVDCVLDDLAGPNGLAFSPDESVLYVVESRAAPSRLVWAYDVAGDGLLSNKRRHIDADGAGALDGIAVDADGNTWCGWGSDGRAGASSPELDGVRVFDREGRPIGHVHLPERCANLCFGGLRRNRLFMAASHSLYALYVNVQGAR
ncbi:MAG: SMP-30/gluconolactonase/LRE family protein [Ideonella sp.]|nr:SMP-30/gluconolactonase/LRE family protein [Ideonella sp.]